MLLGRGTTRAADVWSFGVFLFEIISGYPPFTGASQSEQYKHIMSADLTTVTVPERMDAACADLISLLLDKVEDQRLGMWEGGWEDVKRHAWFAATDWTALAAGRLPCPLHFNVAAQGRSMEGTLEAAGVELDPVTGIVRRIRYSDEDEDDLYRLSSESIFAEF